jgi:hypothetical protein
MSCCRVTGRGTHATPTTTTTASRIPQTRAPCTPMTAQVSTIWLLLTGARVDSRDSGVRQRGCRAALEVFGVLVPILGAHPPTPLAIPPNRTQPHFRLPRHGWRPDSKRLRCVPNGRGRSTGRLVFQVRAAGRDRAACCGRCTVAAIATQLPHDEPLRVCGCVCGGACACMRAWCVFGAAGRSGQRLGGDSVRQLPVYLQPVSGGL